MWPELVNGLDAFLQGPRSKLVPEEREESEGGEPEAVVEAAQDVRVRGMKGGINVRRDDVNTAHRCAEEDEGGDVVAIHGAEGGEAVGDEELHEYS